MWSRLADSAYLYTSDGIVATPSVAGFDLDWTLVRPYKTLFPQSVTDVVLLPGRKEKLAELVKSGWTIAIFTNQKSRNPSEELEAIQRVTYAINLLEVPALAFVSTKDDIYRKPNPTFWNILKQMIPTYQQGFYVGDAGVPGNSLAAANQTTVPHGMASWSDTDMVFARNCGIPYYTPEEFFLVPIPDIPNQRALVVFVGSPGTGKTTWYQQHLYPKGFLLASSDAVKSNIKKLLQIVETAMRSGQSVVVDATNPTQERRQEYYSLAQRYGYHIWVIWFLSPHSDVRNKLRPNPVPTIAIRTYWSKLEPPTVTNTPGTLIEMPI